MYLTVCYCVFRLQHQATKTEADTRLNIALKLLDQSLDDGTTSKHSFRFFLCFLKI